MHKLLAARECGEEVLGIDDISSERWTTLEVDPSRKFLCDAVNKVNAIDLDTPSGQLVLCAGFNYDVGGAIAVHLYPRRDSDSKIDKDPLETHFVPESDGIRCVKWFPNDAAIFLTGNHRRFNNHSWAEVHVWDSDSFRSVSHFRMDDPGVLALDLSSAPGARQELIATVLEGSRDLRLLDMESGASTHRLEGHEVPLRDVEWAPLHPHVLASCDEAGQVCLFDVRRSGRSACLLEFDCARRLRIYEDKLGYVQNGLTSEAINNGDSRARKRQRREQQSSGNGETPLLGLGCSWTPEFSIQARRRNKLRHRLQRSQDTFGSATAVRFSIDGTQVISAGKGTSFRVWDVITGRMISEFHGTSLFSSCKEQYLQMAPDGIHMVWSTNSGLEIIDVQDGMMVHTSFCDAGAFRSMKLHPLEEEVISAHQNILHIWTYEMSADSERSTDEGS
ncbi:WD40/YVTN repeat-like containing protein [Gracilaria domingensis]|nr:WD40/YVTN repeat-like containing protein [Gracilaria domingensis]